jgi:hypothetical protein
VHAYAVAHSAAEIEAVLAESALIAEACQAYMAGHIAGMAGESGVFGHLTRRRRKRHVHEGRARCEGARALGVNESGVLMKDGRGAKVLEPSASTKAACS